MGTILLQHAFIKRYLLILFVKVYGLIDHSEKFKVLGHAISCVCFLLEIACAMATMLSAHIADMLMLRS